MSETTPIRNFDTGSYSPKARTDSELIDDWTLLASKLDKPSTEFRSRTQFFKFSRNVARELLRRGRVTFHPESMPAPSLNLLRKSLFSLVKSGVYLTPPHGEMLSQGKKTSILKSREFSHLENFHILVSGDLAFGYIRFSAPFDRSLEEVFDPDIEKSHKVSRAEVEKWWPSSKNLFEYPLRDFIPFDEPKSVDSDAGTSKVRFSKAHRPDDDILLVESIVSAVGASAHDLSVQNLDLFFEFSAEKLEKALQARMTERFDADLSHQVSSSPPNDDFRPLYDLVLRPRRSPVVKSDVIRLDLGCGQNCPDGFIGIDKVSYPGVDMVWNLERGLPFADSAVREVRANRVLEFLSDPVQILMDIHRVLRPGGLFRFEVQSTLGEGAFSDSRHRSLWNKSTFDLMCDDEHCRELGIDGRLFDPNDPPQLENQKSGGSGSVLTRGSLRAHKSEFASIPEAPLWVDAPPEGEFCCAHKTLKLDGIGEIPISSTEPDSGRFEIGVLQPDSQEIFFDGKILKGRHLLSNGRLEPAPDPAPFADSVDKSDLVKSLQRKGHKWLVWAKPGQAPEKIEIPTADFPVRITKSNDEKRVVFGVVLVPEEEDGQGDIYSHEEVELACHRYMLFSQRHNIQHSQPAPQVETVESYIVKQKEIWPDQEVSPGSWVLGVFVGDDGIWKAIKEGRLTGFSIEGGSNVRFE